MANKLDDTNMSQQEKMIVMTERLQKRDDFRKLEIQKKKGDKEAPVREKCEHFYTTLSKEIEEMESKIDESSSKSKDELIDHFDGITVRLHQAQKFLSESTLFLPSYDISRASDSLVKLQNSLQDERNTLLPKKKFAFKSKKADGEKKKKNEIKETNEIDEKQIKNEPYSLADCKFVNETDKTLSKNSLEINQKDVALAGLTHCIVKLYGAPSAVHVNKLKDCKIFCGPVSGSIFIRECVNCVFVLSCQQLRIHTTTMSNFYIHVTCKAIIEDCSGVKFAPYNWNYLSIEEHFVLSGLEKDRNNWNAIDDFNWLVADVHSPNWSVISTEDRIKIWMD